MPSSSPVILRPLTEADINDTYLAWFRDPVVTQYLVSRDLTRQEALDHLRRGQDEGSYRMYAVVDAIAGNHIGNVKIGPIVFDSMASDLVTVIGHRPAWGRGLGSAAIAQAVAIAFGEMGIARLDIGIVDGNVGSLLAYTRAGFAPCGRGTDRLGRGTTLMTLANPVRTAAPGRLACAGRGS